MNIPVQQTTEALVFAIDYWTLQRKITMVTGEPLPPCYYCTPTRIWDCCRSGNRCSAFEAYCATEGFDDEACLTPHIPGSL